MRFDKFKYASIISCYKEATRTYLKKDSKELRSEGQSRIRSELTYQNVNLFIHPCLDDETKYKGGACIAEYHKSITGKAARMKGEEKQRSAAIGIIATLPRDFADDKQLLREDEYFYLINSDRCKKDEKIEAAIKDKLINVTWSVSERKEIERFFINLFDAICEVCNFAKEDVLYATIHFDESWPHIHIMALPTDYVMYTKDVINKQTQKLIHQTGEKRHTYSTARFTPDFYKTFHQNVIDGMIKRGEVKAKGLLNGATENKEFSPLLMNRAQREETLYIKEKLRYLEGQYNRVTAMTNHVADTLSVNHNCVEIDNLFLMITDKIEEMNHNAEDITHNVHNLRVEKDDILNALDAAAIQCALNEEKISNYQDMLYSLVIKINNYLKYIPKRIEEIVTDTIKIFLPKWKNAKSNVERSNIDGKSVQKIKENIEHTFNKPLGQFEQLKNQINSEIKPVQLHDAVKMMINRKVRKLAENLGPEYVAEFMRIEILQIFYRRYADLRRDTREIKQLGLKEEQAIKYRTPDAKIERVFNDLVGTKNTIRTKKKSPTELFYEQLEKEENSTIDYPTKPELIESIDDLEIEY